VKEGNNIFVMRKLLPEVSQVKILWPESFHKATCPFGAAYAVSLLTIILSYVVLKEQLELIYSINES